jgi:hypothetical protein
VGEAAHEVVNVVDTAVDGARDFFTGKLFHF